MKKIFNINSLFFLSLFLLFLLPPTDPDLGWELRCGQEFWQNHTFCNLNQFSVLLPNYSWPNHYWLYQAILWPIFQFFGLWGLTILNAFLMSLSFFLFYKTFSKNNALFTLLSTCLIIIFGWGVFNLGIRSQEMSFFFFSLLLFLIYKARQNSAIAVFCPLVTLLWANMHGGSVILGIYLLLFFFFYTISRRSFLSLLAMTLTSFLITFVNPFGLKIYEDAFRHFNGPIDLSQIIAEWVPPAPFSWWLILISVTVFSIFLIFSKKKRNIILLVFTLPLAFLALKARRNIPFYFLFFFYALLESKLLDIIKIKDNFRNSLFVSLIVFLLIIAPVLNFPTTIKTNASFQDYCNRSSVVYPCQAIKFLKKQSRNERDNLFNRYEWGGFLIWQLPEMKIFVDGRMPAWPAYAKASAGKLAPTISPYTIYLETLQNQPGWQETLADYKIDWILIGPNTFMDLLLRPKPEDFGWKEAYRDKIAVIYEKIK